MAFGLKYQSDFYNTPPFQKLVSVKIYKRDYEDSEVIAVRTSEVTIEANYKDDNTPVIGTGAKIVIITKDEDMEFLEDLLLSYEKGFMCTIEYDGQIAFRGYSLCDLNERQLLPYAAVTLQFTDYLHRLSEHYPAGLKDPSQSISVMRLVTDLMDLAGLDLPLFVNSTLFETQMDTGAGGTYRRKGIVCSGTSGSANITCGGVTKLMSWGSNLPLTLANFVFAYAADFLPYVLTMYSNVLYFTHNDPDTDLPGDVAINNVSGDLDGVVGDADSIIKGVNSFLPQVFVQNFQFHKGPGEYDSMYDAINKALQPFSGFMFYYKDNWIIERQEDITRDGDWVKYTGDSSTSESSLKLQINKQTDDFEYIETSQNLEYDSGLKTLILRLQDKLLDSLVFNDYTKEMDVINFAFEDFSDFPVDELEYRTWHRHGSVTIDKVGMLYKHMTNFVKLTTDGYVRGLYYYYRASLVVLEESEVEMKISYKITVDPSDYGPLWFLMRRIFLRFLLQVRGGPYDGYWMVVSEDDGRILLYHPDMGLVHNKMEIDISKEKLTQWVLDKTFNLTSETTVILTPAGATEYASFYEALGIESSDSEIKYQDFNLMILPPWYSILNNVQDTTTDYLPEFYFGDIGVTVTPREIDNMIEYYLNEDFVKKDEIDVFLFDLPDANYSNGLLLDDGMSFTRLWSSENSVTPCPLYEVFAKGKFRKYGRTIHRLKARIMCDKILKPFTVITDDNIPSKTSSSGNMTFLLNGFKWDLNNGVYDIEAEEYTEEEIIVDGVLYDEEGNATVLIPDTPAGFAAVIEGDNRTKSIFISWQPVSGQVSNYLLFRKPRYLSGAGWLDVYTVIYSGSELSYRDSDDNFRVQNLPAGTTITYMLYAVNSAGNSVATSEITVVW